MSRTVFLGMVLVGCMSSVRAHGQTKDNEPVRIRVFAHYVSWYAQQNPGVHEHQWDETSMFPIHRGPGVGEGYSSRDPDIIALHNADFIEYGITPLASWWGPDSFAGDGFYDAYLAVESSVQIGTLYEVTGLLKPTGEGSSA